MNEQFNVFCNQQEKVRYKQFDSSELIDKLSNNEIVFVNRIEGFIPSMSIPYGGDDEIFVLEGTQMEVEKNWFL